MTQTAKKLAKATVWQVDPKSLRVHSWYDKWIADQGVPIYQGNHVDDLRTLELGPWEERECNAAFLQLDGQKGIVDLRVTEIPPGATLPPTKMTRISQGSIGDSSGSGRGCEANARKTRNSSTK